MGLEIREDLVLSSNLIASELGVANSISFTALSIEKYRATHAAQESSPELSLLLALHACDTATDEALALGIESEAQLIVVSPCCHHDLQKQISQKSKDVYLEKNNLGQDGAEPSAYRDPAWSSFLSDGIVSERFADLLTDLIRKEIVSSYGYNAEIIEYIGEQHTARNLMMRCVKRSDKKKANSPLPRDPGSKAKYETIVMGDRYIELINLWGVKPALNELLSKS
jgi:hypothetical protein